MPNSAHVAGAPKTVFDRREARLSIGKQRPLGAATIAVGQSNEAQAQRDEAQRLAAAEADARAEAETNEQLAEEQATLAEQQTVIALENERIARAVSDFYDS